jgi:hypothetical protein
LTRFLQGGRIDTINKDSAFLNPKSVDCCQLSVDSPTSNVIRTWYDCGRKMTTLSYILYHIFPTGYLYTFDIL